MNAKLKAKLSQLPSEPGVYLHKDAQGKIIYIGKASVLKRRVSSYFQKNHRDIKTPILVENIADVDWIVTSSEIEALFLESELVKRHKPLYNIELRDDKNFLYIKITTNEDFPRISYVRRPQDDKATYFGPFVSGGSVRTAMRYLRRIFPYITDAAWPKVSALQHQIGVSPPPDITSEQYRATIRKLMMVLRGDSTKLMREVEKAMNKASKAKYYEEAAALRDQFLALKSLSHKVVFGKEETFDLTLDQALSGLAERLGLPGAPKRIEAYDISNFAGGDAVSSMIVFTNGLPDQREYRHFKMRTKGPNDFAMMQETMRRRFSGKHDWRLPDVILIDGGKGQLSSVNEVLTELGVKIPRFGLAKRYEEVVRLTDQVSATAAIRPQEGDELLEEDMFTTLRIRHSSPTLQLLQRVRDEAHRFAVSYHTHLRDKRTKTSELDVVRGVGSATRRKLVRSFGSVAGIRRASLGELQAVVAKPVATAVYEALHTDPGRS